MKNFKRVISAVIALALSASTLVAVSASKFSDVDNTNYAEAIDVLTALDVIHGYEEEGGLVFKPEGEITRAEAATMIVGALNMNADAQAAAGTSKFTDVNEKASWATGYVNVGVAQGFINGMNDTTFAPQENVTYAQMCVMLTLITGYGDYAKTYGGWPTGYTTMAASAGINKGVAVSNDTPLKRGQVAQMLYNAVTAPVLGIEEYRLDGNSYKKMDDTTKVGGYKTILSDKFDGYIIKGTVDLTGKEAGKVDFTDVTSDYTGAANAEDYINIETKKVSDVIIENGIDLSSLVAQQVRAILYLDANNKKHLVFAKATDAVETAEVEADDFDKVTLSKDKKIKFGSTKYNFADSITIYVNGEKYGDEIAVSGDPKAYTEENDAAVTAILKAATGTVKLAKTGNASNYNAIFVDAYVMGRVTSVNYKNEITTVKFSPASNNINKNYKKIEIADNDVETDQVKVSVTLDGKAMELKDLQENDIIAVKTKIDETDTDGTIEADNKNITILVSRDTISGRVTSKQVDDGDNAITVDSTEYAAVDTDIDLEVSKIYNTIYLDAFGRIFGYNDETVEDTTKYAILARVTDNTDIILVLPDGTRKTYEAKNDAIYKAGTKALEISGTDKVTKGTVLEAVVEYTVKNGQINSMAPVTGVAFGKENKAQYKESVGKVGTVGIGAGTGVVLADADTYRDYKAMKTSDFVDEEVYEGAGFGKISGTSNYSLVVVTQAGLDFGANSRFAVVNTNSFSEGIDADGDSVDQLKVLVNGEKTTLDFTRDAKEKFGAVAYGDVFFYTVDSDGLVDVTKKIEKAKIAGTMPTLADLFGTGNYDKDKWGTTLAGNEDIKLVQGLVVKTGTNSVSLLDIPANEDKSVDFDKFETFTLADDCLIYTYDSNTDLNDKDRLDEEGVLEAMSYKDWMVTEEATAENYTSGQIVWYKPAKTTLTKNELVARGIKASKADTLEGETVQDDAQYALALIVDDQVVEIYEILAD